MRANYREILFQIILHLVVFVFYSFDRHNEGIEEYEYVFFASYAVASLFINYFLLPRFLYRKRYVLFSIYVLLTIGAVMVIEELVLEQIYFPTTRGTRFPGVFFTLVGSLPPIVILTGIKFGWDALIKQGQLEKLKETAQESELQFLKSQINPHFLFNNLNNIYSYALDKSEKTPELILKLSSFLRYTLYECQESYGTLDKEIEQLRNYIKLSELQIEDRSNVQFHAEVKNLKLEIAPLLFLVFVENAFKHSAANQTTGIEIDIELKNTTHQKVDFICKNNYIKSSKNSSFSRGIGLKNVKKRLNLLYPNNHQITFTKSVDWYEVQLSIDLK